MPATTKRSKKQKPSSKSRNIAALMTSGNDCWATPPLLFEELNREFHFTLDPCCMQATAKCKKFFALDRGQDGLTRRWSNEVVFMNPPYSAVRLWLEKAATEARLRGATVVCLVPNRTDTGWYHESAIRWAHEIRVIRGRVRYFMDGVQGGPSTFPSSVIVFRPGGRKGGMPALRVQRNPKAPSEGRLRTALAA